MKENKKIGEPSPEAIDFAKRMIALKWTKETNINIIAGNWMAGYVYGKIDSNKELASDKDKEIEGLRQWVEDLVRENTSLKKEINTLNEDYTAEVKKSEKLKLLVQGTDRKWYIAFYRNVSTMTAREIEEGWVKHWKEKFEYSLQENTPEK